ncbi:hypothetical protein L249_5154, partial [Ophiocordyceps polyrhachis-furcata BCC 54312]
QDSHADQQHELKEANPRKGNGKGGGDATAPRESKVCQSDRRRPSRRLAFFQNLPAVRTTNMRVAAEACQNGGSDEATTTMTHTPSPGLVSATGKGSQPTCPMKPSAEACSRVALFSTMVLGPSITAMQHHSILISSCMREVDALARERREEQNRIEVKTKKKKKEKT